MKLVLLGYMACGKTTIAKQLALEIGVKHIDLDAYIEKKEQQTIPEIFKKKGEIYFRLIENTFLKELLLSNKNFILSVGGGTPCYANNMELILKYSNSIYLKGSINTLFERLVKEKELRPLINEISDDKLKEFISKHLFERYEYYEKANTIINVNDKSIIDINKEIITI